MTYLPAAATATLVAASGDRGIKAVIFWLIIALVVIGIILALRRLRAKRTTRSAPDDWQPGTSQRGQKGHQPCQ
jgi:hypothetical protein